MRITKSFSFDTVVDAGLLKKMEAVRDGQLSAEVRSALYAHFFPQKSNVDGIVRGVVAGLLEAGILMVPANQGVSVAQQLSPAAEKLLAKNRDKFG